MTKDEALTNAIDHAKAAEIYAEHITPDSTPEYAANRASKAKAEAECARAWAVVAIAMPDAALPVVPPGEDFPF